MDDNTHELIIPDVSDVLDQNEEWILIKSGSETRRIRLHDYGEIYDVPGLYEKIFYDELKCSSPDVVCGMLASHIENGGNEPEDFRVLDFGAGNGMVAERLIEDVECKLVVGVDILEEAKNAAERDRPGVYDDYHVLNLAQLREKERRLLEDYDFNMLLTVAALGFDDIPSRAFAEAFNLLEKDAWVAFNIRDKFLGEEDSSGYRGMMEKAMGECMEIVDQRDYCHRLALSGEELCYRAIVAKKLSDAKPEIIC